MANGIVLENVSVVITGISETGGGGWEGLGLGEFVNVS